MDEETGSLMPDLWLDPDVRWLTGVHEAQGQDYLVREPYEELLWWLQLPGILRLAGEQAVNRKAAKEMEPGRRRGSQSRGVLRLSYRRASRTFHGSADIRRAGTGKRIGGGRKGKAADHSTSSIRNFTLICPNRLRPVESQECTAKLPGAGLRLR